MMSMVVVGFLAVWATDRLLNQHLQFSIDSRRKVFHLIPLFLLPPLYSIDYEFFTLMLAGSFYLFVQLELVRYFTLPLL